MAEAVVRRSARVLLVDEVNRILLYRALMSTVTGEYAWFTPGGGVRADETPAMAAARELREEIGHHVGPGEVGPVVATCSGIWSPDDRTRWRSVDSYFLLRVAGVEVDVSGMEELERSLLDGFRWWTLPELRVTGERVFPVGLAGLLRRLLDGDVPDEPVILPWE
ncbi:NUDIX domain-containing protein [Nonomuraea turkmeniaca]|uniref:NUDIX domain-containing protein n=1 Tax=Nonomuraea turkmeniaca TaxID=103838 RepID=A0A5S4FK87_9ACTN|nr:NUDIX domain-containing protein [Nonomuraea turkmeniaca]TMR20894.1 NUDIX domain-containing protein [Nonomuraea turkmeniaca]